ncbi:transposase, partial [Rhizobium sp. PP-WC-1G-195]
LSTSNVIRKGSNASWRTSLNHKLRGLRRMDTIIIGVDTNKANHIAVAINGHGARLDTITIPATRKGYSNLRAWASNLGHIRAFGIEGTGSYGAGLSRELLVHGHTVLDVMRPNRQLRYLHGKSDSLDAEGAARSVLNGQATAQAKAQTGSSEMIRHIKVARDSAMKAKSQANDHFANVDNKCAVRPA